MTAEDRERRDLERRAYGRDGTGLTVAEAARLAELRATSLPAPATPVPAPPRSLATPPGPWPFPVPEPVEGTRATPVPGPSRSLPPPRSLSLSKGPAPPAPPGAPDGAAPDPEARRPARLPGCAPRSSPGSRRGAGNGLATCSAESAAMLLIGVGIGFAIPRARRRYRSARCRAGRADAVLGGDYDAGSRSFCSTGTTSRAAVDPRAPGRNPLPDPRTWGRRRGECRSRRCGSATSRCRSCPRRRPRAGPSPAANGGAGDVTWATCWSRRTGCRSATAARMGVLHADRPRDHRRRSGEEPQREEPHPCRLAAHWRDGLIIWLGYTIENEQCLIVEDRRSR